MEIIKKKSKSSVFSIDEEDLILQLVKKHAHIIENKKTDHITNAQKLKAWKSIESLFNASKISRVHRDASSLKTKYDNLKKKIKKKIGDHKKYSTGTGGGPSVPLQLTSVEQDMCSVLGHQIIGLSSSFDNDSVPKENGFEEYDALTEQTPGSSQDFELSEMIETESSEIFTHDEGNQTDNNWGNYTPKMLKQPISNPIKRNKRESTSKGLTRWTAQKANNAEQDNRRADEVHQLKLEHIKELHGLEVEFLKNKIVFQKESYERTKLHEEKVNEIKLKKIMKELFQLFL